MGDDLGRVCACGRQYDGSHWSTLPVTARLAAKELASIVTSWPAELVVEVRTCADCGRAISRLGGTAVRDEVAPSAPSRRPKVERKDRGREAHHEG